MGMAWTKEELEQASKPMIANVQMKYKVFCEKLSKRLLKIEVSEQEHDTIKKEFHS